MRPWQPASAELPVELRLIYELLDAHDDTARMAGALEDDPAWAQHLDYLRALQRQGRQVLAQARRERLR